MTFSSAAAGTTIGTGVSLWADYIYLDTEERRRFAQVSHEYLIEQVQHQQSANAASIELNFNHPVKELVWSGVGGAADTTTSVSTPTAITAGTTFQLKLNGHDRMAARPLTYFTRAQVWQHHSGPGGMLPAAGNNVQNDSIAVYSLSSQKNTSHLEHATSQESTTLSW